MKRVVAYGLCFVLVAGIAIAFVAVLTSPTRWGVGTLFGEGSSSVEQWVGRQLKHIANDALRPEFEFETLDYEFPATVTLQNVTLVDDEEGFVTADAVRVIFTERPRIGEPIVIQSIRLDRPLVRLKQRADGSFVGFTDFVKSTEGQKREDGGSTRPSDVFAIRTISIVEGEITYEIPDQPAMRLDEITLDLKSNPQQEQGWYVIDASLERDALFTLAVDARLNLDEAIVEFGDTSLDAALNPDQYRILPPQLQRYLEAHQIRGVLSLGVSGRMPLRDPTAGHMTLHALLSDAFMTFDDYRLPVHSLEAMARLDDRRVHIEPLMLAALGGTVQVVGDIDTADDWRTDLQVAMDGVRIEEALRKPAAADQTRLAGRVDFDARFSARLPALTHTIAGDGAVDITEGRLVNLPLINGLVRAVEGTKPGATGNDRMEAQLEIVPGEVRMRDIRLVSATVAARGHGEIFFDRRVDFRFNAGPLERLQHTLGGLGELFGKITDQLVTYQVSGDLSDPTFKVKPLGLGQR